VVADAHGDAELVERLADVVRVHAVEREAHRRAARLHESGR
jgi:hypothetical protein